MSRAVAGGWSPTKVNPEYEVILICMHEASCIAAIRKVKEEWPNTRNAG